MEFDFDYHGEMNLVVEVKIGGKFIGVAVPIVITKPVVKAKIDLKLDLCAQMPFVKTLHMKFKNPKVGLSISPGGTFNIMDVIPFLDKWFSSTIESTFTHPIHHFKTS
jgi:Ca2+-dependent lipid-binding protein